MKLTGLALAFTLAACIPAHADTLLLDAITAAPPNSSSGVARPRHGSTMSEVSTQYGEPTSKKDAVGEPPITRWVYPGYTVYFEHDRVIDVVVHR